MDSVKLVVFKKPVVFICVGVPSLRIMCIFVPEEARFGSPGAGVTMLVAEIKVGPLKEEPVPLTPEPSLQHQLLHSS